MKRTILILIIIFPIFVNAQTEYLGEGIYNLEELSFKKFKASVFYSKALKGTSNFAYVKKEFIDTAYFEDSITKATYGIAYLMKSFNSSGKAVNYQEMLFAKMEAITTIDGDLIAISAYSEYNDSLTVNKVIKILDKKWNVATIHKGDFFGKYTCRTWYDNEKIIQLVTKPQINKKETTIIVDKNNNASEIKANSRTSLLTILFITTKKNREKITKIQHGDWLYFH